jgi:hypothetical protein
MAPGGFMRDGVFTTSLSVAVLLLIACSAREIRRQTNSQSTQPTTETASTEKLPLRTLVDVPLTGGTTRFDYQFVDSANGRLYIAHLGSDLLDSV